ncbi:MAG: diguanylate cyclase, partial [Deltaproteobacteria bacterium]|nr:diguanylate cyclase [Deltaproteobacteria bacterium]
MPKKLFKVVWSDWRFYLSIGSKTLLAFLVIIAVLAGGFYYYTSVTFSSHVEQEAMADLKAKTQGAWRLYYSRLDQMKYGMLQAASDEQNRLSIIRKDAASLGGTLERYSVVRPYVNYWAVVDEKGTVISRRNNRLGDLLDINGMVGKALSTGEPVLSTETVSREFLSRESMELASRVDTKGMMQFSVVPVLDNGRTIGAFVTGMLVNGNSWLSGSIHEYFNAKGAVFMFEQPDKPAVVASTGLPNGIFYPLTTLPKGPLSAISAGSGYLGKTEFNSEGVFLAIDPILNLKGEAIGALAVAEYVSVAEEHVAEISSKILVVAGIGVLFSLLLAGVIYRDTSRPVKMIRAAMDETASGNLDVELDIRTKDEFEGIGRGFNQMVESIRVREARLDRFNQLSEILIQYNDPDTLLDRALFKIIELTGSQLGVIYIYEEAAGSLKPAAFSGTGEGEIRKLSKGEGLAGRCVHEQKTLLLQDLTDNDMNLEAGLLKVRPAGMVWFPMSYKGCPKGVLLLGSIKPYDKDEISHVEHLVAQLTIALDNALIHKEIETLSVTDPLTGVFNRRRFMEAAGDEFKGAMRYKYNMGIVMLDADDFKAINDTYGHQQGDVVLMELSRLIKEKTRTTDV